MPYWWTVSERFKGGVKGTITYVCRDVELQVLVQIRDRLDLILLQVEACDIQVLLQAVLGVALGDDGQATLCRPAQENLSPCVSCRTSPHVRIAQLTCAGVLPCASAILVMTGWSNSRGVSAATFMSHSMKD
jgi:hypothetical protein